MCPIFAAFVTSLFMYSIALEQRPIATGVKRINKESFLKDWETPNNIKDVRTKISKYDCIVPVVGKGRSTRPFMEVRAELFDYGVYPGVEYRIINIINSTNINDNNTDNEQMLVVRPVYPLIRELERDWPVSIPISKLPYILTKGMYNTITVIGSFSLAATFFTIALVLSTMFTLSVVNSRSMTPTIQPRDIILVEKITPAIQRLFHTPIVHINDVIFFDPPPLFNKYIQDNNNIYKTQSHTQAYTTPSSSSTTSTATLPSPKSVNYLKPVKDSQLLIKRVYSITSLPTDTTSITTATATTSTQTADNTICIDVRGDNSEASLDSRQWGCLPEGNIVGKPLLRVLPLGRIGLLR